MRLKVSPRQFLMLMTLAFAMTFLGQAAVAGQGLAVLVLAVAEWAGLKSSVAETKWETA